jgi:hypothetical protein
LAGLAAIQTKQGSSDIVVAPRSLSLLTSSLKTSPPTGPSRLALNALSSSVCPRSRCVWARRVPVRATAPGRVLGVHVMTEDAGATWSGLALAVRFTPFLHGSLVGRGPTTNRATS